MEMSGLNSFFIGPKSENGELVEKLINEILKDQFYWRKNYHPEDKHYISEFDKSSEEYIVYKTKLIEELYSILSELKNGVPFFSPRYIGHMVSETTIPSIIGYFAAMLYNANNVTSESSPVTTKYELAVGKMLCGMMGYDISKSWGHITSGGTVANLEAIWFARNILYMPIALRNAIKVLINEEKYWEEALSFKINNKSLLEISGWELLNINPKIVMEIPNNLINFICDKVSKKQEVKYFSEKVKSQLKLKLKKYIVDNSIQNLGIIEFFRNNHDLLSNINQGVILVPQTKHYSYAKIFDVLGLGFNKKSIIEIGCDEEFRMNVKTLEQKILELAENNTPILAVVSVLGTTEEGAIDDHKEISALRKKLEKEKNISFYLHCDAAWGGYIASLIYENIIINEIDEIAQYKEIHNFKDYMAGINPYKSEEKINHLYNSIKYVKDYDSITLDPHKLGYIPYPAGSILFKSNLTKEIPIVDASYVFHEEKNSNLEFIGKYIFEGSKPGASATSCYLSHKVIPLNNSGYGKIIIGTMLASSYLYHKFSEYNHNKQNNFEIIPITEPDTNIICFVVNFKNNTSLVKMNRLVNKISKKFCFANDKDDKNLEYIISKTVFKFSEYQGEATNSLLEKCNIDKNQYNDKNELNTTDKINILRVTCMNPLLSTKQGLKQLDDFVLTLKNFLEKSYLKLIVFDNAQENQALNKLFSESEHELTIKIDYKIKNDINTLLNEVNNKISNYDAFILNYSEKEKESIYKFIEQIRFIFKIQKPIIILFEQILNTSNIKELEDYGLNIDIDKIIDQKSLKTEINNIINQYK